MGSLPKKKGVMTPFLRGQKETPGRSGWDPDGPRCLGAKGLAV